MNGLNEACRKAGEGLKQLKEKITALESELVAYEGQAARWPGEQVARRLGALAAAITGETLRLLDEHGVQGVVFVTTSNTGIFFIRWDKEEGELAGKECYQAGETTVFFVGVLLAQIGDLVTELAKGNWVKAVAWLNTHSIYSEKGELLS